MNTPPPTTAPAVHRLWPDRAPLALGDEPADVPTLTVFPAAGPGPSPTIVVCPGGGYAHLAGHEGEPVARWLNTLGITALVLKYRLGPRYRHPAMLLDAQRAVRTARAMATDWRIDPSRVGILGFSAGGHLCATASNLFDAGHPDAADPVERQSSRPDVSVPAYPVITLQDPFAHVGSRLHLLGDKATPDQVRDMSMETRVTPATPPTFLFHTGDDAGVPVENAMLYATALRQAGVPFELHVYERGQHGVGLATGHPVLSTWTQRCADWLRGHGFGSPTR